MIALLFGTAMDLETLRVALGECVELLPVHGKNELRDVLRSAEMLESKPLLVLAPATAAELEDILSLADFIGSYRSVCFSSREVYADRRIFEIRSRYLGVCDEHVACVREVIQRVRSNQRNGSRHNPAGGSGDMGTPLHSVSTIAKECGWET